MQRNLESWEGVSAQEAAKSDKGRLKCSLRTAVERSKRFSIRSMPRGATVQLKHRKHQGFGGVIIG